MNCHEVVKKDGRVEARIAHKIVYWYGGRFVNNNHVLIILKELDFFMDNRWFMSVKEKNKIKLQHTTFCILIKHRYTH